MQRWKPSGARLNARPWKEANNGPRIGFDGSYSNSSKRLITGAGSTALWGINHLWTSKGTGVGIAHKHTAHPDPNDELLRRGSCRDQVGWSPSQSGHFASATV